METPAILVVDMLNDFVTGSLTCERAKAIVPSRVQKSQFPGFNETDGFPLAVRKKSLSSHVRYPGIIQNLIQ